MGLVLRSPKRILVGDVVEMRKPHPCGGYTWRVLRVGADIGIECLTCHRYVLLPRPKFEARMKRVVVRGADPRTSQSAVDGGGVDA